MREAPENLDYGMVNKDHMHDKANALESILEKGKYETGACPSPEHEAAGLKRMLGVGSRDPMYADSHKNK